ncbi:MAG: HAD family phosphatase [Acidimicrobiales bacterium]
MSNRAPDDVGSVRALLFDLGGVVLEFDFKRAFRVWADRACCDPAELERRFSFDEAYEQHERGELDAAGYFTALRRKLGLTLCDEEIVSGWNDIYLAPLPGMSALLSAASQRLPLYAFTNSNPTHKSAWASRFAIELSVFRSIFVSSDLGLRKPDPEAFTAVADRIGFQGSELLFFDDTPENVDGARRVGMRAVLVESSADVREALLRLGIEVETPDEVEP